MTRAILIAAAVLALASPAHADYQRCSVDIFEGITAYDRPGPGAETWDTGRFNRSDSVLILSDFKGGWAFVIRPKDEHTGWVHRNQINCSDD